MEASKIFSAEEINQQIKRVLDFPRFKNSRILSSFLQFIIEETIQQRELHIKEYSVAINVLHRCRNFNPHDDAIVRIHAGRLRRALEDYYLTQGIHDPIFIKIPKGSYVPHFSKGIVDIFKHKELPEISKSNARPVVAIFPFKTASAHDEGAEFPSLLCEQLSAELSKFQQISVIGYYSIDTITKIRQNVLEAGKLVGADYIITGSLQNHGKQIRILVNLLTAKTGEVLVTKSFESDTSTSGLFEIQDQVVQEVVAAVGGYYGIIVPEMPKAIPIVVSGATFTKLAINR